MTFPAVCVRVCVHYFPASALSCFVWFFTVTAEYLTLDAHPFIVCTSLHIIVIPLNCRSTVAVPTRSAFRE